MAPANARCPATDGWMPSAVKFGFHRPESRPDSTASVKSKYAVTGWPTSPIRRPQVDPVASGPPVLLSIGMPSRIHALNVNRTGLTVASVVWLATVAQLSVEAVFG